MATTDQDFSEASEREQTKNCRDSDNLVSRSSPSGTDSMPESDLSVGLAVGIRVQETRADQVETERICRTARQPGKVESNGANNRVLCLPSARW
jgi:hypothetical protein